MSKTSETDLKSPEEESTPSDSTATNDKDMSDKSETNPEKTSNNCNSSVKRRLRSLTFGRRKNSLQCFANNKCKQNNCQNNSSVNCNNTVKKKKKTSSVWVPFKLCARTDSCNDVTQQDISCESCVCTAYKKTDEHLPNGSELSSKVSNNSIVNSDISTEMELKPLEAKDLNLSMATEHSLNEPIVDSSLVTYGMNGAEGIGTYGNNPTNGEVRSVQVRVSELALALRSQLTFTVSPYPYLARWGEAELTPGFLNRFCVRSESTGQALNEGQQIHTQIDYIHCLVPDLTQITNCSFYWGKMDRYEAERLLDNKPEGTFLLRDSAQEEHLFSVSFRRFDRSLHARIEQWNHRFSFDSHDPGVYASTTVCGLIEHYKDPSHCMFFEPMLTIPLHRNFTFSLQHLSRAAITSRLTYDTIHSIQLPKRLKNYLKEYHYKQQVRVRRLDGDH